MRVPTHRSPPDPIDATMTPMIDVVFQLMIFFICTASFDALERSLPTRLSWKGTVASDVAVKEELLDLDNLVVRVLWTDSGPAWEINERQYASLLEVRGVLEATVRLRADLPVILDVDSGVPMAHVIDVYDLCRAVGLERVQFAASGDGTL